MYLAAFSITTKPVTDTRRQSDNVEAYELLRKTGLEEVEAIRLNEIIGEMASTNIIARLESKMDAQNRIIESKLDAQNSKYRTLIIVISIIGAAMTIILSISQLTQS